MSCLTTTEKAKAIVGSVIHEIQFRIKNEKEINEELWLAVLLIIKTYESKDLANIGCLAAIAEWYNYYNEDTKEDQVLLLKILTYYYDMNKKNGGFCLACPHCKPLIEQGIHKKTLIKGWINQIRVEKCGCGNTLIWEAFCAKSGLDEEYYRVSGMELVGRIGESNHLLSKAVKYELNPNKRKREE